MLNEVLIPGERLTPEQHKHVLSAFVHRHTGEHTPDWVRRSDDHHTPTHKTDKDWVHDHAFHFNKKTGRLSGKHKYAEPHYMADNVREEEIAEKRDPFGFSKKKLAQLGAIDKSIKQEVAAKKPKSDFQHDLEDWHKHDRGRIPKGSLPEAEKEHHAVSKPAAKSTMSPEEVKAAKKRAWQNDERMPWPKDYFMHKGQSPIHSFAAEDEKKDDEKTKAQKKADWKNDVRMPWPKNYTTQAAKSPIHSFAEHIRQEGK
jgi:hypothetical protein